MKEHSKDNYSKILEIINCYESISEKLGKKQHLSKSLNEIITEVLNTYYVVIFVLDHASQILRTI